MVKVSCDFCGKRLQYPEDLMRKVEKSICIDCLKNPETELPQDLSKVYLDIPEEEADILPEIMTANLSGQLFPKIWKERRNRLKRMPPEDMAWEMFEEGVFNGIASVFYTLKNFEKIVKKVEKEDS